MEILQNSSYFLEQNVNVIEIQFHASNRPNSVNRVCNTY